jgi:hypothetical protein
MLLPCFVIFIRTPFITKSEAVLIESFTAHGTGTAAAGEAGARVTCSPGRE